MKNKYWFYAACFVSFNVFADVPTDIDQCYAKATTTLAMRACANQEYSYYDDILNKTYKSLMGLLDNSAKAALVDTQKSWLVFRQKECKLIGMQNEGGSMQPLTEQSCYTKLNKTRIQELTEIIKSYQDR